MIGTVFRVTPAAAIPDQKNHRSPMKGKVVYVHPQGRFAVLEFKGVWGNFRESFPLEQLHPSSVCKDW
ncbi:MAG: hypothetical protein IKT52_13820 [Oscillospiraceae bacterium]|nr:hypothetical protein [Oscillospiraceae bacterium]